MKDWKEKKIKEHKNESSKVLRHFCYGVFIVIAAVAMVALLHPFRSFSDRFVDRGDKYLLEKKYTEAELQYEKALKINPDDEKAKKRKALARNAQKNILVMADFYKEMNAKDELERIELATSVPKSETEALRISKKFIDEGDFELALLPAKTALEMDPDYKAAKEYIRIIEENLRLNL